MGMRCIKLGADFDVVAFSIELPGEKIRPSRACINVCQRFTTSLLDTRKGHLNEINHSDFSFLFSH